MNSLYYGDNLDTLRKYIRDETVDLCYIDPPFNSKRNYNQSAPNSSLGSKSSCVGLDHRATDGRHCPRGQPVDGSLGLDMHCRGGLIGSGWGNQSDCCAECKPK